MLLRRVLLLALLALAPFLTACDDDAPAAPAAPEASPTTVEGHTARYDGPLTTRVRHDPPGLVLDPPPAGARPDVTWSDAYAHCFGPGAVCVPTGDAEVGLAVVTGPADAVIGSRTIFDHTLAYVVTWDPGACYVRDAEACRLVNLLTARQAGKVPAGTVLYAFEAPVEPAA